MGSSPSLASPSRPGPPSQPPENISLAHINGKGYVFLPMVIAQYMSKGEFDDELYAPSPLAVEIPYPTDQFARSCKLQEAPRKKNLCAASVISIPEASGGVRRAVQRGSPGFPARSQNTSVIEG
jgi:hypothetical protein